MNAQLGHFVLRRLLHALLVVVVVSLLVFELVHLAPGSPEEALSGNPVSATPEAMSALREQYGLDRSHLAQFGIFLGKAARLDLGVSFTSREGVLSVVATRMAVTGPLVLMGLALAVALGGALGVIAAHRPGRLLDRLASSTGLVFAAAPVFATGIVLLYVFAVQLGWFPVLGDGEGIAGRLWHLALPAIALGLLGAAMIMKVTRAELIEALRADHVTFARARGVSAREILLTQALRTCLVPIVTVAATTLVVFLSVVALVEVAFGLSGVGALLIDAIESQDIPVIQAIALLTALVTVLVNLGADLLYPVIDPRLRVRPAMG